MKARYFLLAAGLLLGTAAGPVRAGPDDGLRAYRAHEYDEALRACTGGKDIQSRLVLALASAEKAGLYRNKLDKEQAKMHLKVLAVDVRLEHLPILERFLNTPGAPYGNKEIERLFDKAIQNVRTPEDVLRAADYLAPERGVEVNRSALKPIRKRLKPVRDYVNKGGSMPDADRALFTHARLLKALAGCLADKKTAGAARACLVLIEEPALPFLEQGELNKATSDTLVGIKSAMVKRQKKFPESTWFSAYGR